MTDLKTQNFSDIDNCGRIPVVASAVQDVNDDLADTRLLIADGAGKSSGSQPTSQERNWELAIIILSIVVFIGIYIWLDNLILAWIGASIFFSGGSVAAGIPIFEDDGIGNDAIYTGESMDCFF